MMNIGDLLKRLDSRPIPNNREEIRAFMVVLNDSVRLESTLKHYRQLGISRFFIVDGGSTDGTLEALVAAPDVHAFSAAEEDPVGLINALLEAFGVGHWTVTVEPGELLIYPHCEELAVPLFCRYLSHVGSEALACVSIDMYAASPIGDVVHQPGSSLLNTCRYFDAAPYRVVQTDVCPQFEIHGGLRERAFPQLPSNPHPVLSRVPLVRWKAGMRYLRGTANITPVPVASILAAVLRFEFFNDFLERSPNGHALPAGSSTNLYCNTSVRFENSAQLIELSLMTTTRAYEESVQLTAAARAAQSA
jgi:hypothetical protein